MQIVILGVDNCLHNYTRGCFPIILFIWFPLRKFGLSIRVLKGTKLILSAVLLGDEYEASSPNVTEVKILIKFLRGGEYLDARKRR
jgi:hypothetical protein